MRKLQLLSIGFLLSMTQASAQAVYQEILKSSKEGARNEKLGLATRRIYQFKVDGLEYMLRKTRVEMPDSSMNRIDRQAYALYEFIHQYMRQLSNAVKEKDKESIRQRYKNASLTHSMFHDMDQDLVMSYVNRKDYMTPFSLDTDWVQALSQVKEIQSKSSKK